MHADGYDPLDHKGNITIKWDLLQSNSDTNDVRASGSTTVVLSVYPNKSSQQETVKVSSLNFQLYRHIEQPGWKLGWEWLGKEVIWSIQGAEATEQGNCSRFKGGQLPHCCENKPLIVDLLPGAPYNIQTSNCCKGGVLSSMIQDPTKYAAVFQMNIRAGGAADSDFDMPQNFSLGVPGYTCAKPVQVAPSKLRWWPPLDTSSWHQLLQNAVSPYLHSTMTRLFIVPSAAAVAEDYPGQNIWRNTIAIASSKRPKSRAAIDSEVYTAYVPNKSPLACETKLRRVKITVNNLNILKNYSGWNLVALHPNLKSLTQVFSFNYHPFNQYGHINDSGMFWGVEYYNDMLLQEGEVGNVQSEMLLHKDEGIFSFREGWVFPRRILFNGDECVMPPPDDYPRLPKNTARAA
ncbi:hypothetical protein Goklo_007720, partial [Gossypium klotzschianum]|nr:hypothetical protein [Gossypium klotzschianum]